MRLGSLPDAPDARVIGFPGERHVQPAAIGGIGGTLPTAAAGLRAAIAAARTQAGAPVRMVAVIGVDAADDAPGVALALAVASAQAGQPTLLVDADVAAPTLHDRLGLAVSPGLAELAPGSQSGIARTALRDLALLPAGAGADAATVLERGGVFARLRPIADRFAATVVLAPADHAQAIAAVEGLDGAVLVVRRDVSSARAVAALSSRLAARGAPVIATACFESER